jgi:L-cystine transport system permease protein
LIESFTGISPTGANKLFFVVITLSMFSAASLSEIMRASYQAVDRGQYEAAVSIGLTKVQAFMCIVLPQAFFSAIPNLSNTILFLLKEGSLAYIIGLIDVIGKANYIVGLQLGAYLLETYVALVLIYWPLSIVIGYGSKKLEGFFNFDQRKLKTIEDVQPGSGQRG